MGRQSIWEYFRSVYARYRQAAREMKRKMLDEFCANTGYNRKYALRLLNGVGRQNLLRHKVKADCLCGRPCAFPLDGPALTFSAWMTWFLNGQGAVPIVSYKEPRSTEKAEDEPRSSQAASCHEYRWCSPPTRGRATILLWSVFLRSTGRPAGVSLSSPS